MISLPTILLWLVAAAVPADLPDAGLGHAAGVSLAEVTELKEHDERPACGNLYVEVSLKTLRGSGTTLESIKIVKAYGGRGSFREPPVDALLPVPFEKGKRYWFVWASPHEWQTHRHWIIRWLPEDDPGAAALHDVVAQDRFVRRPHREPTTGISYERYRDGKTWRVRGTRDGDVLWEVALEGEPVEVPHFNWAVYARKDVLDLAHTDVDNDGTMFLRVVTLTELAAENPYDVPAGKYWLSGWYELETGRRAAVEVLSPQLSHVEWLVRTYERTSGRPLWERMSRFEKTGGRAVGAQTESWLRQVVGTYDAKTGKKTGEQTFRVDGSKPVKID